MTPEERRQLSVVLAHLCRAVALGKRSSADDLYATSSRLETEAMDSVMQDLLGSHEALDTGGFFGWMEKVTDQLGLLATYVQAHGDDPVLELKVRELRAELAKFSPVTT